VELNWIDTHAHLYQPAFDDDIAQVVDRALVSGVSKILLPNIDLDSIESMMRLCAQYPDVFRPMMGLHPCDVKEDFEQVLNKMEPLFAQHNFVAVGETGMDLYWDKTTLEIQKAAFEIQVDWAIQRKLPLVIHARDAFEPLLEILDRRMHKDLRGVFHCFTGDAKIASHIAEYGSFYFGIGGVLTYPKAGLENVIPLLPTDRIILETDSPYLPPVPHRGKRNESAYLVLIAEKLSGILGIGRDELSRITNENAKRLFGIVLE
jgi:TatD DNase family protein